jgi:flagellar basal-body rod modification protein FlgD
VITATTATTSTSSSAASAVAQATAPGGALGEDEFMKMLIAQLQNQDPTNPMDGTQMAAQLAQFSSLEQLQEMNTTLTNQSTAASTLLGAVQSNAAIGTIGHSVLATGNQVELGGANGATSVTADVGGNGATATLSIYDASGNKVGSRDLGAVSAGRQTFDLGSATDGLGDGTYTYSVDVKDAQGNAVTTQTYVSGKVTGVSAGANGLSLDIGDIEVSYGSVVQVLN